MNKNIALKHMTTSVVTSSLTGIRPTSARLSFVPIYHPCNIPDLPLSILPSR